MPASPNSLTPLQQELINVVKATHQTLAIARKVRSAELSRRLTANNLRAQQEFEADLSVSSKRIKMELDAEVEDHASNLDEALIAAYEANVPVRRIALDGFGNRYDGGVVQLLTKLRDEGRVGFRSKYQRNTGEPEDVLTSFPQRVDVESILKEALAPAAPTFTFIGPKVVVPAGPKTEAISADAVQVSMDARDPYFKEIAKFVRPTLPEATRNATTATLIINGAGTLSVLESREASDQYWDHPVARWVKDHPEEALAGYYAAFVTSD